MSGCAAPSKEAMHQFHPAALKAGAKDNGPPGFRREYGDDYYAAFVLDFDGNNIEACDFGEKALFRATAAPDLTWNFLKPAGASF